MLNYKMKTFQIETTEGVHWVAQYPTLPGVLGTGLTVAEAVADLMVNAEAHIELLKEIGESIPTEDALIEEPKYSGRLTLRTSKVMHQKILESAQKEGISANQWMVESLGYAVGKFDVRNDELLPLVAEVTEKLGELADKSNEMFTAAVGYYKDKSIENNGFVKSGSIAYKKENRFN